MKNFKKQAIPAIFMLLMAIISLTGVSFAWFADAKKAEVKNVNIMIKEATGVAISLSSDSGFARYVDLDTVTGAKLAPVSAYVRSAHIQEAEYEKVTEAVRENTFASYNGKLFTKSGDDYVNVASFAASLTEIIAVGETTKQNNFEAAMASASFVYEYMNTAAPEATPEYHYVLLAKDGTYTSYNDSKHYFVAPEFWKQTQEEISFVDSKNKPLEPEFFDTSIGLEAGRIASISKADESDYIRIELFFESTSRAKNVFFDYDGVSFAFNASSTKSSVADANLTAQEAIRIAFVVYNTSENMVENSADALKGAYNEIQSMILIEPAASTHLASRSLNTGVGQEAYYALINTYTVDKDTETLAGDGETPTGKFEDEAKFNDYAARYQLYKKVGSTYVKATQAEYHYVQVTDEIEDSTSFAAAKSNHNNHLFIKDGSEYKEVEELQYKKVTVADQDALTALINDGVYTAVTSGNPATTTYTKIETGAYAATWVEGTEYYQVMTTGYFEYVFDDTFEYYRENAPELYQLPDATHADDQAAYMKKIAVGDAEIISDHKIATKNAETTDKDPLFSIDKGYTKVVMYIWLEGQDADCLDSISLEDLVMNFSFYCLDKAE